MKPVAAIRSIHVACDHAGFTHKEKIVGWLREKGFMVVDHGATIYDADDDFPDYISLAAAAVSRAPQDTRALIFGGSGNGEAILANRYPGVRAAVYHGGNLDIVRLSREHNDANVLSIGARFVSEEELVEAVALWLETRPLGEEKYQRRNKKIEIITKQLRSL